MVILYENSQHEEETFSPVCLRVEYWRYEQVACPPASGARTIHWTGELTSALLHVELQDWVLTSIELNGNTVWRGRENVVDVDVTKFLVKGTNRLTLWYDAPWCAPWFTKTCYAYIDVCSTGEVEVSPPPPPAEWWQPLAVWGVVAVVAVVGTKTVLDYVLRRR